MTENIMQTAMIFTFIFIGAIKFHGDNEPSQMIKIIEVVGMGISFSIFVVSMLILVWTE